MLIAIDIDGTIAGYIDWTVDGAIETFVTQYCPEGGLRIPAEKMKRLVDGRSLFQLPEVVAYRQIHEARWQEMLGEFRRSLHGMKAWYYVRCHGPQSKSA